MAILKEHLSPKPLLIAERFRFHKRDQRENENIHIYVAEIRKLSEHCEFGTALNDSLRDRLVCGLRNEAIQKRILVETSLTFEKALKVAVAMEAATKDLVELRGKAKTELPVYTMRETPKQHRCYRCGKEGHDSQQCHFKDQYCRNCRKKGHIKRVCRGKSQQQYTPPTAPSRKKKGEQEVHEVQNESDSDSEDTLASLKIHKVAKGHTNIIWVTPEVEGKSLQMELDTGSAVSVLPLKQYNAMFKSFELHPTTTVLKTYTGEKIQPKGVMNVQVQYKEEKQKLNLYVVDTKGPALFGRDWLEKITLDWKTINVLSATPPRNPLTRVQEIFDKFTDIGRLSTVKAKLTLRENSQPKFCKARQVPYALRPKVEAELTKLQNDNILTKVEWSEWATPVVPVIKKNGNVQEYPLPRIDDIFATLGRGGKFSKIDLRQAYLQVEMEEESKKLLTINTHKGLFQYNRLVFGVASAPAIWQQAMDQILEGIPHVKCILDDM
ncbi:uncharacterized protein K02A2.6-like [Dendronephthya gigantea]|uniref:uncharacterized protein K02A2.6-like n=1 Tax=Dendronephthya gigantea TaxID=151771 RepID=UPI0010697EB0|nr:uncharacterized protein K02A2.6-like [Dendronephthya gigantea]